MLKSSPTQPIQIRDGPQELAGRQFSVDVVLTAELEAGNYPSYFFKEQVADLPLKETSARSQVDSDYFGKAHQAQAVFMEQVGDKRHELMVGHQLTKEVEDYRQLFLEFRDVFAWSYAELAGVDPELVQHRIPLLPYAVPQQQRAYKMNPSYAKAVHEELQKLLDAGFIEEVETTDWLSPIVVVRKKNGKLRVCVDYRRLNAATRRDGFPLPFTDVVLDGVVGKVLWMVIMDITRSKWLLRIKQRWHSLQSGTALCLEWDSTEFGISLNPGKCQFRVTHGVLLGRVVLARGLEVDPAKVNVVEELEAPQTVKELQAFLGHVGYHRRFIWHYVDVAFPLTGLLKKNIPFAWTPEQLSLVEKNYTATEHEGLGMVSAEIPDAFSTQSEAEELLLYQVVVAMLEWYQGIAEFLAAGRFLDDMPNMAQKKLLYQSQAFTLIASQLYREGRDGVLMCCILPHEDHYILICTDYVTKWVEAEAFTEDMAKKVARFLYKNIIMRFDCPLELVSDQGMHFINAVIIALIAKYGISHQRSTPYHPRANNQVERTNMTLCNTMTKLCNTSASNWDTKLLDALWAYRVAYKEGSEIKEKVLGRMLRPTALERMERRMLAKVLVEVTNEARDEARQM
ncbi:uncharacterized protein LOC112348815 [Selaginella moellendorffii]|uniref:uncharacterized protein LOC112348815 n=1 Tax=Selaginella moellendorffii TaxID=88036 RepID=UPI000D1C986C|nr:uncharacterized protein LOC112348815 [Selaginella moellendorffii]|eukprot:XP_024537806.1 uncharacterized protein LOC112348815 [Selaginella moellendorffii]